MNLKYNGEINALVLRSLPATKAQLDNILRQWNEERNHLFAKERKFPTTCLEHIVKRLRRKTTIIFSGGMWRHNPTVGDAK